MTPPDPQVSGWKPNFLPAAIQLDSQRTPLRSLIGDQIMAAWTVWIVEDDEWFADLPVVLQLKSGRQFEVCWEKFDDLSITWDTIDLAVTPQAWVKWPLQWRTHQESPFGAALASPITELAASRFRFRTENVERPHDVRADWLTAGLWIGTQLGGIHVFNALDENGVSADRPAQDGTRDLHWL